MSDKGENLHIHPAPDQEAIALTSKAHTFHNATLSCDPDYIVDRHGVISKSNALAVLVQE